jgi:aminoglycoside phosphotransferase (APT) family kinase protein
MSDLKLLPVLEASAPARIEPALRPFLGQESSSAALETTRLEPPVCYWAVYRAASRRVTLKTFFSRADYDRYAARLAEYYPDRIGEPTHPCGGILFLPELNGVLWGFPFDPSMPGLGRCLDGDWVAGALQPHDDQSVTVEAPDYNPEISALFRYRSPATGRPIAYGKATPEDNCGFLYLLMRRLWGSEARRIGRATLARPLAFRPEAGLLLQEPLPGRLLAPHRNRQAFMDLARAAAGTLAALHAADVPFGAERHLERGIQRLEEALPDLTLIAPALSPTLRLLISQIDHRAGGNRSRPLVPSHGDFKWDQFLVRGGSYALLDFEFFCRAEPGLDLGSFCAYLPPSTAEDWREAAAAELLRAAFLQAYEEQAGRPVDLGRLALYESIALATRALGHAWAQGSGWELRAAQLLDLAFERLVNPMAETAGR